MSLEQNLRLVQDRVEEAEVPEPETLEAALSEITRLREQVAGYSRSVASMSARLTKAEGERTVYRQSHDLLADILSRFRDAPGSGWLMVPAGEYAEWRKGVRL